MIVRYRNIEITPDVPLPRWQEISGDKWRCAHVCAQER
jgi:hypothetical protein